MYRRTFLASSAALVVGCTTTPRTIPLAFAVGQRGVEAMVKLDSVLAFLQDYPSVYQAAKCQWEILSDCETPEPTLPAACRPDPTRDDAQTRFSDRISKLRTLTSQIKALYTLYFELASYDSSGKIVTIVSDIDKQLAAITGNSAPDDETGRKIGLLTSTAAKFVQASNLQKLNLAVSDVFSRVTEWWSKAFNLEVIMPIRRDREKFVVLNLSSSCFAPPAISDAVPFSNAQVRSALRQVQYELPFFARLRDFDARLVEVELALNQLSQAHLALQQDRPSVTDVLGSLDGALQALT